MAYGTIFFTRENIEEHLNSDHTCYTAQGYRHAHMRDVSFSYINAIPCEKLTVQVDDDIVYRHESTDPDYMLNGITNALKTINAILNERLYG